MIETYKKISSGRYEVTKTESVVTKDTVTIDQIDFHIAQVQAQIDALVLLKAEYEDRKTELLKL